MSMIGSPFIGSGGATAAQVAQLDSNSSNIALLTLNQHILNNAIVKQYDQQAVDQFEDETGVATKTNLTYDAGNDYYTPDDIRTAKTLTGAGGVKHNTLAGWINPAPILFDGTDDRVSTPSDADFTFGTGDFTFEGFASADISANGTIIAKQGSSGGGNDRFYLLARSDGRLQWVCKVGGVDYTITPSTSTYTTNTRVHWAVVRNGNTVTLYQDGAVMGTADMTGISFTVNSDEFNIGAQRNTSTNALENYLTGSQECVRVSTVARYTADFSGSIPSANFTDDSNTVLLLLGDQADESTTFTDTTGWKDVAFKSNNFTADSAPSTADAYILIDPVSAGITKDTDIIVKVTRDGGTTYTAGALVYLYDYDSNYQVWKCDDISLSSQPSGTSMALALDSANSPDFIFKGWVLQWV